MRIPLRTPVRILRQDWQWNPWQHFPKPQPCLTTFITVVSHSSVSNRGVRNTKCQFFKCWKPWVLLWSFFSDFTYANIVFVFTQPWIYFSKKYLSNGNVCRFAKVVKKHFKLGYFCKTSFYNNRWWPFFARISNFIVEKITLQFTFSTKRLMRSLRICWFLHKILRFLTWFP